MRELDIFRHRRRTPKSVHITREPTDSRWYFLSCALLLAGVLLHQPLLVVISILVLLVLLTIDIWAKYCLHDLHYQRSFSEQRALFGEEITLSLTIENAKILPLPWLEVEDMTPRALPIKDQEVRNAEQAHMALLECLFSPAWYERITRHYTIRCLKRGIHTFGPTRLRSGDVFGFISREAEFSNRQFVLVYPLVVPLTRFSLPARNPFGERRAPRRLLEDPSRVVGIRDYQYGDSLRRVHWKATARTMQLQSKVYEATTTYTMVIFLNIETRPDTHYGIHPELQELSICAAASITQWGMDNGYAVGLYANSNMFIPEEESLPVDQQEGLSAALTAQLQRRRIHLPASSSEEQRRRIMEALARIQGYFGSRIEDSIQSERSTLPAGATVVLITSTMSEQLIDKLGQLRRGGHVVTVLFVGDMPVPSRLAGVTIYHIGGESRWQELEAAYSKDPTSECVTQEASGFQL
jgi:uncharacterized protein (DUF58 family)